MQMCSASHAEVWCFLIKRNNFNTFKKIVYNLITTKYLIFFILFISNVVHWFHFACYLIHNIAKELRSKSFKFLSYHSINRNIVVLIKNECRSMTSFIFSPIQWVQLLALYFPAVIELFFSTLKRRDGRYLTTNAVTFIRLFGTSAFTLTECSLTSWKRFIY